MSLLHLWVHSRHRPFCTPLTAPNKGLCLWAQRGNEAGGISTQPSPDLVPCPVRVTCQAKSLVVSLPSEGLACRWAHGLLKHSWSFLPWDGSSLCTTLQAYSCSASTQQWWESWRVGQRCWEVPLSSAGVLMGRGVQKEQRAGRPCWPKSSHRAPPALGLSPGPSIGSCSPTYCLWVEGSELGFLAPLFPLQGLSHPRTHSSMPPTSTTLTNQHPVHLPTSLDLAPGCSALQPAPPCTVHHWDPQRLADHSFIWGPCDPDPAGAWGLPYPTFTLRCGDWSETTLC